MGNNITEQYSSTIISIYNDVVKKYESNVELIKQLEEELNDLNHEIELSPAKDMYKGYLLYKEIRDVRNRRRTAKDENSLLQDMYDFLKSPQGQSVKSKFQQIQGNSVKTYDAQNRRTYVPRQRNDLTITGHVATVNKPFEDMLSDFMKDNKVTKQKGKLRK